MTAIPVYEQLGVRRVLNARGTVTALRDADPSIRLGTRRDPLSINPVNLAETDGHLLASRLHQVLAATG